MIATGKIPMLPKTVQTGCGIRRPFERTSKNPKAITCLACREYAKGVYERWADGTQRLLDNKYVPDHLKDMYKQEIADARKLARMYS
jgi:hypothetical protein